MINPIKLTKINEEKAGKERLKKYYRFHKTHFYGGCATADVLGCNLRCAYCWSQQRVWAPETYGKYYSPTEVREKLIKMNISLLRVSGGEPTIFKNHLRGFLLKITKFKPKKVENKKKNFKNLAIIKNL